MVSMRKHTSGYRTLWAFPLLPHLRTIWIKIWCVNSSWHRVSIREVLAVVTSVLSCLFIHSVSHLSVCYHVSTPWGVCFGSSGMDHTKILSSGTECSGRKNKISRHVNITEWRKGYVSNKGGAWSFWGGRQKLERASGGLERKARWEEVVPEVLLGGLGRIKDSAEPREAKLSRWSKW